MAGRITANTLRPGLLAVFACALVHTTPLQAQSRSVQDLDARLQRVEQVLDRSLFDLLQQIEALKQEIRELRGDIETIGFESDKQMRRDRELYRDTDQRMAELESRLEALQGGEFSGLEGAVPATSSAARGGLDSPPATPDSTLSAASSMPSSSRGSAVIVVENARATATTAGSGIAPPRVPVLGNNTRPASQEEKSAYTEAYDLLAAGQNDASIRAFNDFLRQYPDGPFSDNAWYWQGEARYAQRDFDTALRNFAVVVDSFPESTKVPDARLKIGYSLYEQGRYGDARKVLDAVVNDYKDFSVAVLARKRLRTMDRENR